MSPGVSVHFPPLTCFCAGSSTVIPNFRLSDLLPSARELHSYYRYVGSMTTPGCEQAVAWTVFHRTLSISSRQVRAHIGDGQSAKHGGMLALTRPVSLHSLFQLDDIVQQCRFWTGQPMMDIFRPTQPLDGRVVYRSQASAALKGGLQLWFSILPAVLGTLLHWIIAWKQPVYATFAWMSRNQ